ncbi:MAG: hypothetical protein IJH20_01895 [Bacilli bacterium]|nr:hypothetical protein [Bacilli bacterium]
MELLNNLGITYSGDYISQGSLIDKCKKSAKLKIKNTEIIFKDDGKDTDYKSIVDCYSGDMIIHVPTINISQSNLKAIKEILSNTVNDSVKLIIIPASSLLYETYEWSTIQEQQNYLRNTAKGIASLITYGVPIAIENTTKYKNNLLFGKSMSNIADLLVYTRSILVDEEGFTKEDAANMIGISLNVSNLREVNEIGNIDKWFRNFYNDLKCIKIDNIETNLNIVTWLLDAILLNNIDCKFMYGIKSDLEDINNEFNKFEYIVNNKLEGKELNFDHYHPIAQAKYNEFSGNFTSAQSGYTNMIIIIMVLLTIIIAVLMFMVKWVS